MASQWKFGFPVYWGYLFYLSGHFFWLRADGIATLDLLGRIHARIPDSPNPYWLLRVRAEILAVRRLNMKAVLPYVVDRTSDRNIRVLAIWLRGRLGGHLGTEVLAKYATCADDTIRKEVVRALVRMNAWSRLAEIAERDVNPRIRRLAAICAPTEYKTRFARFAQHVAQTPLQRRNQELYVAANLDLQEPKSLRSTGLIRAILERIRDLVHGWKDEP